MRRICVTALSFACAVLLSAAGARAELVRVYITNSAGDSIHVIDPATNKVVQEIKGIEAAHGIGFAPDGSKVFVSNESDSTLDVFDRESGKLIKKIALSNHPNNIAVTPNGDRVVVAIAREPGAVDVIDAKTLTLEEDHSGARAAAQHLRDAGRQARRDGLDPEEAAHRGRSRHRGDRLGAQDGSRRPADDHRGERRRVDQAHLRADVRLQRLRGGRFRRPARK